MIGPLVETTVWNKRKEKVDILFLLRTDKESKYLPFRQLTKIRNILDESPLTSQLSFDLVDWWDSGKYLDEARTEPAAPRFDHRVVNEGGKFNYMAVFRRSIAMYSSSRQSVLFSHWSRSLQILSSDWWTAYYADAKVCAITTHLKPSCCIVMV